jgi:hypothetical protein
MGFNRYTSNMLVFRSCLTTRLVKHSARFWEIEPNELVAQAKAPQRHDFGGLWKPSQDDVRKIE